MSQKVRLAVDKTDSVRQPGTRRGCELLSKSMELSSILLHDFFSPYSFFKLTSPDIYILSYRHLIRIKFIEFPVLTCTVEMQLLFRVL